MTTITLYRIEVMRPGIHSAPLGTVLYDYRPGDNGDELGALTDSTPGEYIVPAPFRLGQDDDGAPVIMGPGRAGVWYMQEPFADEATGLPAVYEYRVYRVLQPAA